MFTSEMKYMLLIIVIFIAACVETDIYLPAFPDMMTYFAVSEEAIQGILVWNLIGICLSGPIYGPLSDAIGRKRPLMFALGLFFLGSLLTLWAEDYEMMLWGRFLQGCGSGGCFTLGTAVIFDAFESHRAVHALNKINAIVPFIMAAAPLLGGYLNHVYGFRSNFIAIAVLVAVSFLICQMLLGETLAVEKRRPLRITKVVSDFWRTFKCVPFWQTTLVVSLLFSGYIAFLSGMAVLFVLEFGVSKIALPFYQGAILGTWLVASLLFKHCLTAWGIDVVKRVGIGLVTVGALSLFVASFLTPKNPLMLTAAMMLYTFGTNWAGGLYFPEGMQLLPDIRGVTASVLTSTRLLIAAVVVYVTSLFYDATILPYAFMVGLMVVLVLPLVIFYEKARSRTFEEVSSI